MWDLEKVNLFSMGEKWKQFVVQGRLWWIKNGCIFFETLLTELAPPVFSLNEVSSITVLTENSAEVTLCHFSSENLFNSIKNIYKKPTTSIIFSDERLDIFSLRWGTKQECPLWSLLFNVILKFLTNIIRQEK